MEGDGMVKNESNEEANDDDGQNRNEFWNNESSVMEAVELTRIRSYLFISPSYPIGR